MEVGRKKPGPDLVLVVGKPILERVIQVGQLADFLKAHGFQILLVQKAVQDFLFYIKTAQVFLEIKCIHLNGFCLRRVPFSGFEDVGEQLKVLLLLNCFECNLYRLARPEGMSIGDDKDLAARFEQVVDFSQQVMGIIIQLPFGEGFTLSGRKFSSKQDTIDISGDDDQVQCLFCGPQFFKGVDDDKPVLLETYAQIVGN